MTEANPTCHLCGEPRPDRYINYNGDFECYPCAHKQADEDRARKWAAANNMVLVPADLVEKLASDNMKRSINWKDNALCEIRRINNIRLGVFNRSDRLLKTTKTTTEKLDPVGA